MTLRRALRPLLLGLVGFAIGGCGEVARLTVAEGTGADPKVTDPGRDSDAYGQRRDCQGVAG